MLAQPNRVEKCDKHIDQPDSKGRGDQTKAWQKQQRERDRAEQSANIVERQDIRDRFARAMMLGQNPHQ